MLVLVTGGAVIFGAAALWAGFLQADGQITAEPAPLGAPNDDDRRQRAQEFLGGDPDHDVRGGQEMKPRW